MSLQIDRCKSGDVSCIILNYRFRDVIKIILLFHISYAMCIFNNADENSIVRVILFGKDLCFHTQALYERFIERQSAELTRYLLKYFFCGTKL
jgi:hypothetical protein